MHIPGFCHHVRELFLENVLKITGFTPSTPYIASAKVCCVYVCVSCQVYFSHGQWVEWVCVTARVPLLAVCKWLTCNAFDFKLIDGWPER